jgi:hypothetical protein
MIRNPGPLKYLHTRDNKKAKKKKTNAGWLKEAAIGNEQHIFSRTIVGGLGFPQAFQDGAYHLQNFIGPKRIPGDPWDGRHAKIHQDLGSVPRQDHQSPGLGDALHLSLLRCLLSTTNYISYSQLS